MPRERHSLKWLSDQNSSRVYHTQCVCAVASLVHPAHLQLLSLQQRPHLIQPGLLLGCERNTLPRRAPAPSLRQRRANLAGTTNLPVATLRPSTRGVRPRPLLALATAAAAALHTPTCRRLLCTPWPCCGWLALLLLWLWSSCCCCCQVSVSVQRPCPDLQTGPAGTAPVSTRWQATGVAA